MFKVGDKVRLKDDCDIGIIEAITEHRFTEELICIVNFNNSRYKLLAKDLELVEEVKTITAEEFDNTVYETNPYILFKDIYDAETLAVIGEACATMLGIVRVKLFEVEND